ncbi:UNVERIFIED_CONTAM: hypothetical protein PYX00_007826 [Menopon gallinae]|uniref:Luciferin 4-monooxygenase n=1 Tax=Menopon gallinae TaxID=328185 RepID=A0AAW2HKS0_9NEOP
MADLPIITHEYIMIGQGNAENIDANLGKYILESMKAYTDIFLVHAETGESVTYGVILKHVASLAESLKSMGVKPNDVIGICSENRLEYIEPILAILSLGATVVTLNPLYTTDELKHVLSISRASILFCSPFTAPKLKSVQRSLSFIKEIIFFDDGTPVDGFTRYTQLLKKNVDVNSFRCVDLNPRKSVAVILCSSGTTGLPKCVELTHTNIMCFMKSPSSRYAMVGEEGRPSVLGLIPFFHGYGFCVLLLAAAQNTRVIVMSKFDEKLFLSSIEKYRISLLCIVPPLVVFLAKHPLVDKYDLSSLKRIVSGAAPLSKDVQKAAQERLRLQCDINQGYGMTELSVSTTKFPENRSRIGSVGVVVSGMECKIIDPETGKALPPFKEGELCFRGPYVMKGYKNNPKATAETIDSEGWLHTGDIGYYDEEGFLFIVDRLKELIKYKGFQVAPAELEALLLTNPKIKDAGVVGLPDEEAGELPMAFVVKQPNVDLTESEVKNFVARKVSPQKRLHVVRIVDEVPKNPSGKILRRELRKMIKSKL